MAKFLMWIVLGFLSLLVWKSLSGRSHLLRRNDRDRRDSDRTDSPPAAPAPAICPSPHLCMTIPTTDWVSWEGGRLSGGRAPDRDRDHDRATRCRGWAKAIEAAWDLAAHEFDVASGRRRSGWAA